MAVFEMRRERIPDRARGRDKGVKESRSLSKGITKIFAMIGASKNMRGRSGMESIRGKEYLWLKLMHAGGCYDPKFVSPWPY